MLVCQECPTGVGLLNGTTHHPIILQLLQRRDSDYSDAVWSEPYDTDVSGTDVIDCYHSY